jgi:hypothetical protein
VSHLYIVMVDSFKRLFVHFSLYLHVYIQVSGPQVNTSDIHNNDFPDYFSKLHSEVGAIDLTYHQLKFS